MDQKLLLIFQSCDTIHQIRKEFSTPIGKLRFLEKRKLNKLVEKVKLSIESLKDDYWTIEYLAHLQQVLFMYGNQISDYMKDFYVNENSHYYSCI